MVSGWDMMPVDRPAWGGWLSAMLMALALAGLAWLASSRQAAAMELCSGPVRFTCVVDGDTVWIEGEKIRLADIDAPEPAGACLEERLLAARAADRLAGLLAPGDYAIERDGKDVYQRTLAIISVAGVSVGATLVAEGLARPWAGRKERWCEAAAG